MNRKQVLSIGIVICGAVLILAILWALGNLTGGTALAAGYTAGDAEITGQVKNLDLQWTSGRIVFATHSGSTIRLQETCSKPLAEDEKMQWLLDGDTLRVRYEKPAFRPFSFGKEKVLTVTLPEGLALTDALISATSAGVEIPALQAQQLKLDVTSGDITAAAVAEQVDVSSTSGDITLTLNGAVKDLKVSATSGNVGLTAADVQRVQVTSTSGGIGLTASRAGDVSLHSTSGSVYARVEEAGSIRLGSTSGGIRVLTERFDTLSSDSTSGSVRAFLPALPGFKADLHTTSGRVTCTLPLTRDGSTYVCGDGSARVDIGTTSGDITVMDAADPAAFID